MTEFIRHAIPDVVEVIPPKYGDHRGFFSEVFKLSAFEAEGIQINWIQDNQSLSAPGHMPLGLGGATALTLRAARSAAVVDHFFGSEETLGGFTF